MEDAEDGESKRKDHPEEIQGRVLELSGIRRKIETDLARTGKCAISPKEKKKWISGCDLETDYSISFSSRIMSRSSE